ncbi:unnamed protein product [Rhizophagus irregularis]|nr:unnamed protein product [Rhizophagus irregularis]
MIIKSFYNNEKFKFIVIPWVTMNNWNIHRCLGAPEGRGASVFLTCSKVVKKCKSLELKAKLGKFYSRI